MESSVGPSAAMRACTAFCAPLPSATMVITAPTPMMMPSIVSNDRSLLARIAWSATRKISPRSMLRSGRRRLRSLLRGRRLLLLDPGQAADGAHALLHIPLRIEQRGTGQYEHRVLLGQPAQHLDVIEVRETSANLHRRRLTLTQRKDDVARNVAPAAHAAATSASSSPSTAALKRCPHCRHRVLLGRR